MIGRLRGTLLNKQPPTLLIEVGGIGYDVEAPLSTFAVLPAVNQEAILHTHLAVREDAQVLYGFATLAERDLFRDLIKVSGIGAKLALTILSGTDADELARCVHDDDVAALTRLPGIGRKTAQRLLVELRDRMPSDLSGAAGGDGARRPQSPENDAREALISLGFKPDDAARRLREVADPSLSAEELIRRALQATVRG
jgi:Holliday junction DNA helicase RuvA